MRVFDLRFSSERANLGRYAQFLLGCAILLSYSATAGAAISSSGDVTPDPNTTTSSQTLYIGRSTLGAMTVDGGSIVASGTSYIGDNVGATGAATITGSGSTWNSRNLTVGRSGSGRLTISAGGKVNTSAFSTVGDSPGSTGTVEVIGAGAEWNGSSFLTVGNRGNGTLIVSGGGLVSTSFGEVGGFDGVGHATVTGAGSRWINSSTFAVGAFGIGTMTIADGGMVSSSDGSLGNGSGDSGRLTIDGPGSKWMVTNELSIGESGSGVLDLNGGLVEIGRDTYLGRFSLGTGEIRFDGGTLNTGGLLTRLSDLQGTGTINTHGLVSDIDLVFDETSELEQQIVVADEVGQNVTINLDASAAGSMGAGYRGQGSLTIAGGRDVFSRDGYLGYHAAGVGNADVAGAGSTWTLSGTLTVGNNGAGMLSITDGGAVTVAGATRLARSSNLVSSIRFDTGTLTTQSLFAAPNQLAGTGVVNTRGLVSDIDLVFDESHPLQQQLIFDDETDQNITINLDVNGTGALGAGYRGQGSLTIDNVAVNSSSGDVGVRPGSNGVARVTGENARWTMSGDMFIGQSGMGELTIDDGGEVSNASGRIGGGKVTVTGIGSTWTNTRGLAIGDALNASAELLIENGGSVTSASLPGSPPFGNGIGVQILSTGKVTVTGAGSSWTNGASLTVGEDGAGLLTIADGGRVSSMGGLIAASCGFCVGTGTGTVTVSGPGSMWLNNGALTISNGKPGTLSVLNGGSVSSTSGAIAATFQSNGTVNVTGQGSTWTMSSNLSIGNFSGGTGTLTVGPGGTVAVGGETVIQRGGTLKVDGGTFSTFSMRSDSGGQFQWTAGRFQVARYTGNLTNSSGVLAAGRAADATTIFGGFTQQAAGTLEIELGGADSAQYDTLTATFSVMVGGQLQVGLTDDFVPGPQHIFTIVTGLGNITGAFANVPNGQRLTTSDGLGSFLVHYGTTSPFEPRHVVLTNFQSALLAGDFNQDGSVEAADYVVWRRNPSGNVFVDTTNYNTWRANFGRTAPELAGSASVPEPSSCALIAALLSAGVLVRSRLR